MQCGLIGLQFRKYVSQLFAYHAPPMKGNELLGYELNTRQEVKPLFKSVSLCVRLQLTIFKNSYVTHQFSSGLPQIFITIEK